MKKLIIPMLLTIIFMACAWARTTTLDTCGMHDGEPIFRPAICAWEAWKAAWNLTMPNVELRGCALLRSPAGL
jgi:hypothetical protein